MGFSTKFIFKIFLKCFSHVSRRGIINYQIHMKRGDGAEQNGKQICSEVSMLSVHEDLIVKCSVSL